MMLLALILTATFTWRPMPVQLWWQNPNVDPTYIHVYRTTIASNANCPSAIPSNYKLIASEVQYNGPYLDSAVVAFSTYCWYVAPYPQSGGPDAPPSTIYKATVPAIQLYTSPK